MKTVLPDFYEKFECKAGACRHSCCKGWEIDVDEDSFSYYKSLPNGFGKKICENIFTDEEGAHFRLTADERCPFLRDDNLCEMILTLGEDSLCDICALHPRFFEDYNEYELAGVGLSCEKVCELLWEEDSPLRFFVLNEAKENSSDTFSFFAQEKTYAPNIEASYVSSLLTLFQKTEPIDENWTKEMEALVKEKECVLQKAEQYKTAFDSARYQRLFQYICYRQLEFISDPDLLLTYATRCTDFIFITDAYFGDTLERIRRFSEQIEYSTKNVDIICQMTE